MNRTVTLMALLIANIAGLSAQTQEVIDDLNRRNFWCPYVQYMEDDGQMEAYLRNMADYSRHQLKDTRESVEGEHQRAQKLLQARKDICGKKKGKKADALLAKHFKDIDMAKRAFANAEQAERRYEILARAIDNALARHVTPTMPAGRLLHFGYTESNGFAGYRFELEMNRNKEGNGGTLKLEERRMRSPDYVEKEPVTVAVDDSVFVRVRDIVERGELYDVGRSYQPDIAIMDASNWSMYFKFEKGTIDSSGYASGPDHHDTLREVLRYLDALYKELLDDGAATDEKEKETAEL